jgi:coproporphyrinogen III oxidase-like Fe-S oxidoreductase
MTLDALKVALLAAGTQDGAAAGRLHGELEHFLDRQIASDELDAAVADLAAAGLVVVSAERFAATDAGRATLREHWEAFFPA